MRINIGDKLFKSYLENFELISIEARYKLKIMRSVISIVRTIE